MNFRLTIFLLLLLSFGSNLRAYEHTIFVTSIPKCGTHLLLKAIYLMTKQEPYWIYEDTKSLENNLKRGCKQILTSHVPYSLENEEIFENYNTKCFFIYRDPRDQVISYAHWEIKSHPEKYRGTSPIELMRKFIDGSVPPPHMTNVNGPTAFYHAYLGWRENSNICTIKFEDLVGPLGGGDKNVQIFTLQRIANHLGLSLSIKALEKIANSLFGETHTFRSGKIGAWKDVFLFSDYNMFKKVAGDLLIELEYESDYNW